MLALGVPQHTAHPKHMMPAPVLLEFSRRLVSPFVLREYLRWLTSKGAEREGSKDEWKGFMLAVALGACSLLQALVNHQQPWCVTCWGQG